MSPLRKIFHFNPTCELAIANGSPYYQAPAILREFEEELAPILLLFASSGDHVLKEGPIAGRYLEQIGELGLSTAQCLSKANSLETVENETVLLQPWGWSPAESLYLSDYQQTPDIEERNDQIANSDLFQRKHAVELVNNFLNENPEPFFPGEEERPKLLDSLEAVEDYLFRRTQIVLKAPLSSSGRGLQVIRKSKLNDSNIRWIKTRLNQQNYLVAEPLFNKKTDLSFQFELKSSEEIVFHGVSYFKTNSNGQYLGHYINPIADMAYRYFQKNELCKMAQLLTGQLQKSQFQSIYQGFIGVDAIIYEADRQIKIQPCLEINPRFNMGILSQAIEQKIHPESSGVFQTYYQPKRPYRQFAEEQAKKNPPFMADQQLRKGFISLTAPKDNSLFGAYLLLS